MSPFLLIFLCLAGGAAFRIAKLLPPETARVLNAVVLNVSLPAVAILALSELRFSWALWFPASMAWIVFAGAWVLVRALAPRLNWSRNTQAALVLTAGLGNTSFVGFPLIEAWMGHQALSIAVIVDQLGSFLVVSSLGLLVASASRSASARTMARRLFTFPPFVCLVGTLVLRAFGWHLPQLWRGALEPLASTMVPLALIAVGFQLRWDFPSIRKYRSSLLLGLLYKLFVAPAIILALALASGLLPDQAARVTLLEAAMAPMVTGAILAMEFDREPELASLMIACGIPLSLITVGAWFFLSGRFS